MALRLLGTALLSFVGTCVLLPIVVLVFGHPHVQREETTFLFAIRPQAFLIAYALIFTLIYLAMRSRGK